MALTTFEEIKQELIDQEATEDDLSEFADGYVPIYYNEIIQEWIEMPNDYTDRALAEGILSENATITQRMSADLWFYYTDLVYSVYHEIDLNRDDE